MGVSGTWYARREGTYATASKWGTGTNPIHAVRDQGRGRQLGVKQNLIDQGPPSPPVAEALVAAEGLDWLCDSNDYGRQPGEYFRYQDERPGWGVSPTAFRGATNSPVMGEQPSWGVHHPGIHDVQGHQLAGPPGGNTPYADQSHGSDVERQHAIAVFTPGVTGGWLGKIAGAPQHSVYQDPSQANYVPAINTSDHQGMGVRSHDNGRATLRGTDGPRAGTVSRVMGQPVKAFARDWGMGGGPGTPDMFPTQQTTGRRRPFKLRQAATARPENHQYNAMEGRGPCPRTRTPATLRPVGVPPRQGSGTDGRRGCAATGRPVGQPESDGGGRRGGGRHRGSAVVVAAQGRRRHSGPRRPSGRR
jgi:hypothetical protein